MRNFITIICFITSTMFLTSVANAGSVTICNETSTNVRVAAAVEQVFSRSWGWERVRTRQCKDVVGRFNGGYIYFRIEFLHDAFSTENRAFVPENQRTVQYCVNPKTTFDYLYNNRGCSNGLVKRDFFEAYSDSSFYTLTIHD